MIAGTPAVTELEAAAIILGAAEAHVIESAETAQLITSTVAAAYGEERTRELRAHGADLDWDQAVTYTLTQTTQALKELLSQTPTIASVSSEQRRDCFDLAGSGHAVRLKRTATKILGLIHRAELGDGNGRFQRNR